MSLSSQLLEISGSVDIVSKWNLQMTGHVLSDRLFAGIPFSDEIPGLREEVPAVKLSKEFIGLAFVLHGYCEGECHHLSLDCSPGRAMLERLTRDDAAVLDIGKWLAQLVGNLPEFHSTGHSPS